MIFDIFLIRLMEKFGFLEVSPEKGPNSIILGCKGGYDMMMILKQREFKFSKNYLIGRKSG